MPTFTDDPVVEVTDAGIAIASQRHGDTGPRWVVYAATGQEGWGDGTNVFATLLPSVDTSTGAARVLFDLSSGDATPVGIVLNQSGASMSITAEGGTLVFRNETLGANHITAILTENGITFPNA
jgi:hypothetical protein